MLHMVHLPVVPSYPLTATAADSLVSFVNFLPSIAHVRTEKKLLAMVRDIAPCVLEVRRVRRFLVHRMPLASHGKNCAPAPLKVSCHPVQ